jgi:hypothetical protein
MIRCITTLVVVSAAAWTNSSAEAARVKTDATLDLDQPLAALATSLNRADDTSGAIQLARHVRHPRHQHYHSPRHGYYRHPSHFHYRHPRYRHHLPHPSVRHYRSGRYYVPVRPHGYCPTPHSGLGIYGPNVSLWFGF